MHASRDIFAHRWTRLLKQQSSITVYRLPTKEKQTSDFRIYGERKTEAQ
jgi:hypothetical protein